MIAQFILWILPPILYFILVRFMRKNVEDPFIPRVAYWFTPILLIPILGDIIMIVLIIVVFVALASGVFDFDVDSKFYKKWIDAGSKLYKKIDQ